MYAVAGIHRGHVADLVTRIDRVRATVFSVIVAQTPSVPGTLDAFSPI
jgi:hypothetical protein